MTKNQVLTLIIIVALLAGGIVFALWLNGKSKKMTPTSEQATPTALPTTAKALTWNDEAGFAFQYPEGVEVKSNSDDEDNYANLTVTSAKETGKIEILMSDDTFKTLDKWAGQKSLAEGNAIDTTLGDKEAKKVLLSAKDETIVGAIDQDIVVTIKKTGSGAMIDTAFSQIVDTFEFVYPTPTAGTAKKKATPVVENDGGEVLEEEPGEPAE